MSRRKRDAQFWESANLNNAGYIQYYNRLTELSISMFEWTGMPDTVDTRLLELILFSKGWAVFFKDEVLGYLALPVNFTGDFDVNMIPYLRTAYSLNGKYNIQLTPENSVIIWNNMLRTPSALDVELFSRRLYNIDRTIDVNVNAQKTPVLITCDENQLLTLKNVYKQYDGNMPVIFGDKNLNPNSLKAISTGAPYLGDKLTVLKTQIWNEALTYLGISNVNVMKKERLLNDEIKRNQGGIIASRYSRIVARQTGADEINRMFPDLNISCEYRADAKVTSDYLLEEEQDGEMVERSMGGE